MLGTLRAFTQADQATCSRLIQDFFNYHRRLKGSHQLMELPEADCICQEWAANNTLLVYDHESIVIGFIRLRKDGETYWIEDITVDTNRQGHGHGKQMIAALEAWLNERGQSSLFVFVLPENTAAIDFYIQCGFTTLNMLELRKDINQPRPSSSLSMQGRQFSLEWHSQQTDRK